MRRRRPYLITGIAAPVFALTVSISTSSAAAALDLAELGRMFGAVGESRVEFREQRFIAAVTAPIERSGTLVYVRPGRLEMNVASPVVEHLTIADGTLTIASRGTTKSIRLSAQPALLGWSESLRATLSGDVASLRAHFDLRLTGTSHAWALELAPRDAQLRAWVSGVFIEGSGVAIRRIETREPGGDRSVMMLAPVVQRR